MTWPHTAANGSSPELTLPYGVFSVDGGSPRVGARVGDQVLDLAGVAELEGHRLADALASPSLNPLMALGPAAWAEARRWVILAGGPRRRGEERAPLGEPARSPRRHAASAGRGRGLRRLLRERAARAECRRDLPAGIPRSADQLEAPADRLSRSGRHGRVVSGTDVVRPAGQRQPAEPGRQPDFGPSTRLDIECEVGFLVGGSSPLGTPVPMARAREHIFGVVLLNDWSARDIQAWEYVPLGPFLGKSFATSISAWVVPFEALDAAVVARTAAGASGPPPILPAPRRSASTCISRCSSTGLSCRVRSTAPCTGRQPRCSPI